MKNVKSKVITSEVDIDIADWLNGLRRKGEIKTWHINEALKKYKSEYRKTVVK